jgi:catechol-2,3-dioxygenase
VLRPRRRQGAAPRLRSYLSGDEVVTDRLAASSYGRNRMTATEGEIAMGDKVVVSLGVEDIERAKQFFCEGLGFEIERADGPFAAFKE